MTGRPTELPCVVHSVALEQPQFDRSPGARSLVGTAVQRVGGAAILCLCVASALAAPTWAAAVPVPKSRPGPVALAASAGDGRAPRVETSRLGVRLAMRLRALSRLLAKTGLDLDRLVAAASPTGARLSEGLGGPLVPAAGRGAGRAAERAAAAEFDRVRRIQKVLLAMPLAAPMTEYKVNSGFGYRGDPMRRRGALHTGMDLGGHRNAPILATAPGTVVEAGRSGAYGIMVVIDHGMGIETRYAHLSRALVRVGDKVTAGRTVGVMGRTGRATGAHLHYEIRVDGRPLNPRPFLEAGGQLQLASG
jgi:murein DD-endopeptidase MepM/ murein hydrolase activator NlpD